ncbi:hypothetical protein Q5P01_000756 [Channa striata]|uniref:Uncharacterized protein n=1 Tax=Channa striata TaxID=64152 RepID=A0AA88IHY7_CHASR|nr:hypothetical protein Q5P01_000756 [Channa striata]
MISLAKLCRIETYAKVKNVEWRTWRLHYRSHDALGERKQEVVIEDEEVKEQKGGDDEGNRMYLQLPVLMTAAQRRLNTGQSGELVVVQTDTSHIVRLI